ncbi:MAG: PEP-CTERM sorting domain-containing protein [Phycisphaerales bacterium]
MNKAVVFTAAIAAASMTANAELVIDVVGSSGSGFTTWTFSGSSTTNVAGSMRTNADNTFNAGDTGQFPFGLDTILNTSYQDMVFAFSGAATVTIGGTTENITGIFLDDDGGSADDLGVRLMNELAYDVGVAATWSGSGTVNVDIDDFALGTWSMNSAEGQAMFISDPIIINFRVPAPGSLAVLGLGGLVATRRRR